MGSQRDPFPAHWVGEGATREGLGLCRLLHLYWNAEALARIGPRTVPLFLELLRDPNPDIRWRAAYRIGDLKDARAVEPLIAALRDPDLNVRACAAQSLGRLNDRRATAPLCGALRDPDKNVRHRAAQALGNLADRRAVEALCAALVDTDYLVRMNAIRAMWPRSIRRDPRLVPPLIRVLQEDVKDVIRREAAEALGNTRDSRAFEPLLAGLKDTSSSVRETSATARSATPAPSSR